MSAKPSIASRETNSFWVVGLLLERCFMAPAVYTSASWWLPISQLFIVSTKHSKEGQHKNVQMHKREIKLTNNAVEVLGIGWDFISDNQR